MEPIFGSRLSWNKLQPMDFSLTNVTRLCFVASYAVALLLELVRLLRAKPYWTWLSVAFGASGLLAHTLFLIFRTPFVASPNGSLLLLAWVVAIFYLYGSIHHRQWAWAIFVLPLILVLVGLSGVVAPEQDDSSPRWFTGDTFWGAVHGSLLLLSAIGLCVACVASVMYLVQANRVRNKATFSEGLRLPSLERLLQMNRRAINWAFPLLTTGLMLGVILLTQHGQAVWTAPKVFSTVGLWAAFALILYLRYSAAVSNRRLAVLTIAAFGLLLIALLSSHPVAGGGGW
jgi:ABC-type uncharacterized transport system permease subunit